MTAFRRAWPVRAWRFIVRKGLWLFPRPWILRWYMHENAVDYPKALAAARGRKATRDELGEIQHEFAEDYWMLEEEYEGIFTRKLLRQAHKLRVDVPPRPRGKEIDEDDHWRLGHYESTWMLKPAGIKRIRTEINAELDARRARLNILIGIIGALAGLVAALTGLAAVLRSTPAP